MKSVSAKPEVKKMTKQYGYWFYFYLYGRDVI